MRIALLAVLVLLAQAAKAQGVEELQRQIRERDAKISELNERLESREKQTEPDDEELNRALERTLVQQGAMVLPARRYELEPQLAYAYWDRDRGPFRSEWYAALSLRAGVGWQSQVQLRVPYVHVATATDSATGLGDISLSVTRQLVTEAGRRPGLFAALGWLA